MGRVAMVFAFILAVASCTAEPKIAKHTLVFVDVSRSYFITEQGKTTSQDAVLGLVPYINSLGANDSLFVAKIEDCSFGSSPPLLDLEMKTSEVARYKQRGPAAAALEAGAAALSASDYTDITGALLAASERLSRLNGSSSIVLFTDLMEDRNPSCSASIDNRIDLRGSRVYLASVSKLREDIRNPNRYFDRIESWTQKLKQFGAADVTVVGDSRELIEILERNRGEKF